MGDIDLEPMRNGAGSGSHRPAKKKMRSNITVGMFDGGIIEDHVLLKGYAKEMNVVNTTAHQIRYNMGIQCVELYCMVT